MFGHRRKDIERNGDLLTGGNLRECGEVLRLEALDRIRGIATGDGGFKINRCHMNRSVGKVLHDIADKLTRKDGLAFFFNQRGASKLNRQLKIGCLKGDLVTMSNDVNTRKNR